MGSREREPETVKAATLSGLPDACLGCSSCVLACPVTAAEGRFAGPKVLGPAFGRRLDGGWPGEPGLGPAEASVLGAELCLQCHQCDLACPSGVAVSALTRRAKTLARELPTSAARRFAARLVVDQERFGRLAAAGRLPRRALWRLAPGLARRGEKAVQRALGLAPERSLPRPSRSTFDRWFQGTRRPVEERDGPPVLLFAGCHTRFYDPAVGEATVKVLRKIGYRVVLPPQVCCGSPALNSGMEGLAARAARANLRLLGHASARLGGDVPIVTPCPSCTLALRRELPGLVSPEEAPAARRLAGQVWDLGEFLDGPARPALERVLDRGCAPEGSGEAWTYHTSCHLRALAVGRPFPGLLEQAGLGAPLDPGSAADGCCGMGGLEGLLSAGYRRSLETGRPVLDAYRTLDAGTVILCDCPICRWQLAEATGRATEHPVEALARLLVPEERDR